uniref:hypothetical protein n=1 Tax=Flavobacterium sp. Root935 TaxID=1736610 RepID=UPI0009E6AC67|nr:hypothetical protein [Flavobacterium sp. Root935]
MNRFLLFFLVSFHSFTIIAQQKAPIKPRILISSDIGGTDPDDNQSFTHLTAKYREKKQS